MYHFGVQLFVAHLVNEFLLYQIIVVKHTRNSPVSQVPFVLESFVAGNCFPVGLVVPLDLVDPVVFSEIVTLMT